MLWQSSADQIEKKHTDIFSRAREGEAAFERGTGNKNLTVVLEVVPRTTTTHSGVEGFSGPCHGRVPKTEDSSGSVQHVVVNFPTVGHFFFGEEGQERKVSAQSTRVLEKRAQLTRGTGRPRPRRRSSAPRHQPPNRHGAPAVAWRTTAQHNMTMLCTNV